MWLYAHASLGVYTVIHLTHTYAFIRACKACEILSSKVQGKGKAKR